MALRETLRVGEADPKRIDAFRELYVQIIDRIDENVPYDDLLSAVAALSGGPADDPQYVEWLHGSDDVEEFAERAALGVAPRVLDLTREELVEIVRLIREGSAPRSRFYMDLFCRNVSHSAPSDLIYWPEKYWPKGYEPTAEEVVEKAIDPNAIIRL